MEWVQGLYDDTYDIKHIVCKYTKKRNTDPTRLFFLPSKTFDVSVKFTF
jgi:hypothetical protein